MTTIRRAAAPQVTAAKPPVSKGLTAQDTSSAQKLKPAILDLLTRVRLAPIPVAAQPKLDAKAGVFKAPNGNPLFPVALETPPKGGADMYTKKALVDPSTNTFYVQTTGGKTGAVIFNGPLAVASGLAFKGKHYSLEQVKLLGAAAATKPAFHASPKVLSASYSGGMGMRPPGGVYAGPRVNVQVQFPNITYKPTFTAKLDEKTHTLNVVVDASSGNPASKSMTKPQDLMIPVGRPADLGGTYKLVIKDYQGKVLSRSTFQNMLPA
jgi:hypothetical protein